MITVEAKKVATRVIEGRGNLPTRSNLRIKKVRPRMRLRRSVDCAKFLKKFLRLLVHHKKRPHYH
jgi:hypothetical protein